MTVSERLPARGLLVNPVHRQDVVRSARYPAVVVVLVVAASVVAGVSTNLKLLDYLVLVAIFGVAVMGYDFLVGIAGQFALGNSALFLVGAYVTGYASVHWNLPSVLEAVLAVGGAMVATLVVGAVTLRLRGLYFGIATLIFGTFMVSVATSWTSVTGGASGLPGIRPLGGGTVVQVDYTFWMPLAWASVAVVLVVGLLLRKSSIGQAWATIARDETLASSLGINIFRSKLNAFVLSGACAGYAGFLYAHYVQYLTPDDFGPALAISMLLMVYLGGAGSVWGALVGAMIVRGLVVGLPTDNNWSSAAYALILLAIFILLPGGVAGAARSIARRPLRA